MPSPWARERYRSKAKAAFPRTRSASSGSAARGWRERNAMSSAGTGVVETASGVGVAGEGPSRSTAGVGARVGAGAGGVAGNSAPLGVVAGATVGVDAGSQAVCASESTAARSRTIIGLTKRRILLVPTPPVEPSPARHAATLTNPSEALRRSRTEKGTVGLLSFSRQYPQERSYSQGFPCVCSAIDCLSPTHCSY